MRASPADTKETTRPEISSFDVFDTVLTRAVGSPESVFLLLGRTLSQQSLVSRTPEAFVRARVQAESRACGNVDDWCTLAAIYTELATSLGLTDAERDQIMNRECALEAELLRVVPSMRERMR